MLDEDEDSKIINLFKGLLKGFSRSKPESIHTIQPVIIPRAKHTISRNVINENALKVLYRLHKGGYSAYLVGGCVRDILLNREPKDYDIATSALPEEVRKLFRNCRLIGKRFRLAHIVFGKEIIEVATFRTHHKDSPTQHGHIHQGMIIRDNVYGAIEDDAWRRDFTVNALYYNIADFSLVDYTGGMEDLKANVLRMIGNPEQRFHEDPVRLLRAIRFVGKLDLTISPETEVSILELSHLLTHVSPARLYQEVLKFFQEGATLNTFKLLQKYHLFEKLFPLTAPLLDQPITNELIEQALSATDKRWHDGKSVSPAFLFAIFLWHPVQRLARKEQDDGIPAHVAFEKAIRSILRTQIDALTIPRTLQMAIHDIFFLQHRLSCRYGAIPYRLLEHPRFRAGYDLLLLRNLAGEKVQDLAEWWIKFSTANSQEREIMLKSVNQNRSRRKRKSKPRSQRNQQVVATQSKPE